MKKKIVMAALLAAMTMSTLTGCGQNADETTQTEATDSAEDSADSSDSADSTDSSDSAEDSDSTQAANPWTESDREGVATATGFDLEAPDGATDVAYSYMEEDGLAQMSYTEDDIEWTYRMQFADELTDISGIEMDWMDVSDGTVSDRTAKYYSYCTLNDDSVEDVQMVNWYDIVPGVTYSLSATATDLNGLDIQVYAENLFDPLQGEATDDPEGDRENELNNYFLGEHTKSYDGSTLTITDNGDDTFKVDISIVGLCNLENGTGTFDDHKMYFEISDPNENPMSGVIYLDSDNSLCVKITDSTWDLLPNDEVIDGFGK